MRFPSSTLSTLGLALLGIILPPRAGAQCTNSSPRRAGASGSGQWPVWGRDASNNRFQSSAGAGLSEADVPKLRLKWAFNLGDVVDARGQPTVVGGRVYVATPAGKAYALDAKTGCSFWSFTAEGPLHGAIGIGASGGSSSRQIAVFGDQKANAYAVDAITGALLWRVHVDNHVTARITGSPLLAAGLVHVPVSSYEEVMALAPKYECCTFRGSVVALEASTGRRIWQTYTVSDTARPTMMSKTGVQQHGPSGAAIWSAPTLDARNGVVYVSTGNNYSDPATLTSDAVIAISAKTGALLWSKQLTANDAENVGCDVPGKPMCPDADGPDADFGQPPILASLPGGRRALVIGQKSGLAYALDPDRQGAVIWQARVAKGGKLGGSQWGSAADGRNVYVAASDLAVVPVPDSSPLGFHLAPNPTVGGGLTALDLASGAVRWKAAPVLVCGQRPRCSPAQSAAVSVMPGVVFSGSVDGHLRAYSASSGAIIWDFDAIREFETVNGKPARGGSFDVGGVAIASGMVYVSSGYALWGGTPGNVLLAFSVGGK